eukprot:3410036-Rhodomonas_salina.1
MSETEEKGGWMERLGLSAGARDARRKAFKLLMVGPGPCRPASSDQQSPEPSICVCLDVERGVRSRLRPIGCAVERHVPCAVCGSRARMRSARCRDGCEREEACISMVHQHGVRRACGCARACECVCGDSVTEASVRCERCGLQTL